MYGVEILDFVRAFITRVADAVSVAEVSVPACRSLLRVVKAEGTGISEVEPCVHRGGAMAAWAATPVDTTTHPTHWVRRISPRMLLFSVQ